MFKFQVKKLVNAYNELINTYENDYEVYKRAVHDVNMYVQFCGLMEKEINKTERKIEKLEEVRKQTPNYDKFMELIRKKTTAEASLYAEKQVDTLKETKISYETKFVGKVMTTTSHEEIEETPIYEADEETINKAKEVIKTCEGKLAKIPNREECWKLSNEIGKKYYELDDLKNKLMELQDNKYEAESDAKTYSKELIAIANEIAELEHVILSQHKNIKIEPFVQHENYVPKRKYNLNDMKKYFSFEDRFSALPPEEMEELNA